MMFTGCSQIVDGYGWSMFEQSMVMDYCKWSNTVFFFLNVMFTESGLRNHNPYSLHVRWINSQLDNDTF